MMLSLLASMWQSIGVRPCAILRWANQKAADREKLGEGAPIGSRVSFR